MFVRDNSPLLLDLNVNGSNFVFDFCYFRSEWVEIKICLRLWKHSLLLGKQ